MVSSISKHNPLFPPSPTANAPSDSLSAQLDGHDGASATMAPPEPYLCSPDVDMPSVVPSLMNIVAHLMLEVCPYAIVFCAGSSRYIRMQ